MVRLGDWLGAGPFGLVMSSGFFAFYAHTGMVQALLEAGFAPHHTAGASAGALVGGAWAAGLSPRDLGEELLRLERADFWDPGLGAGLLAGKKFDAILRRMLPTSAIEACRVPLRISVFDILARKTAVLDRGDLALAIRASCAVPAMFQPVVIERRPYWDGGVLDRPGLAGVPPGRVLFHHITSRSPWRLRELAVPRRDQMITLAIADLPRSSPFRLEAGRQAMTIAREATMRALDATIVDSMVHI